MGGNLERKGDNILKGQEDARLKPSSKEGKKNIVRWKKPWPGVILVNPIKVKERASIAKKRKHAKK